MHAEVNIHAENKDSTFIPDLSAFKLYLRDFNLDVRCENMHSTTVTQNAYSQQTKAFRGNEQVYQCNLYCNSIKSRKNPAS